MANTSNLNLSLITNGTVKDTSVINDNYQTIDTSYLALLNKINALEEALADMNATQVTNAKLVGSAGGTISTSAGTITLPTSDYDFAIVKCVGAEAIIDTASSSSAYYTYYTYTNGFMFEYSIFKGAATTIVGVPAPRTRDAYSMPSSTLTLSGNNLSYTASGFSFPVTVELYKYI